VIVDDTPPPGGGYLILNPAQIGNWDLVCLIKRAYPRTRIEAQQMLPARLEGNPLSKPKGWARPARSPPHSL
jgi:hypothetical protein